MNVSFPQKSTRASSVSRPGQGRIAGSDNSDVQSRIEDTRINLGEMSVNSQPHFIPQPDSFPFKDDALASFKELKSSIKADWSRPHLKPDFYLLARDLSHKLRDGSLEGEDLGEAVNVLTKMATDEKTKKTAQLSQEQCETILSALIEDIVPIADALSHQHVDFLASSIIRYPEESRNPSGWKNSALRDQALTSLFSFFHTGKHEKSFKTLVDNLKQILTNQPRFKMASNDYIAIVEKSTDEVSSAFSNKMQSKQIRRLAESLTKGIQFLPPNYFKGLIALRLSRYDVQAEGDTRLDSEHADILLRVSDLTDQQTHEIDYNTSLRQNHPGSEAKIFAKHNLEVLQSHAEKFIKSELSDEAIDDFSEQIQEPNIDLHSAAETHYALESYVANQTFESIERSVPLIIKALIKLDDVDCDEAIDNWSALHQKAIEHQEALHAESTSPSDSDPESDDTITATS